MKNLKLLIITATLAFFTISVEKINAENSATLNNGIWYSLIDLDNHELNNNSYELKFSYPSNKISYQARHQLASISSQILVEQYRNGWSEITRLNKLSDEFKNYSHQIDKTATAIKFTDSRGTLSRYVKEIFVQMAPHFIIESNVVEFDDLEIGSGNELSIKFKSLLSSDTIFAISSDPRHIRINDNGSNKFVIALPNECKRIEDKYELPIKFYPTEAKTYTATITIWDKGTGEKQYITITGKGIKLNQKIEWCNDYQMNVGNTLIDVARATSKGKVTYTSSNPSIIEISGNKLIAKTIGNCNITATQSGSNRYNECSATKEFIVTDKTIQTINWEQDLFRLKDTDPKILLNATANSNLSIRYQSSNPQIVTISGSNLIIKGVGECIVTAFQDGNDIYASTRSEKLVRVRPEKIICDEYALIDNNTWEFFSNSDREYKLTRPGNILSFSLGIPGSAFGTLTITENTGKVVFTQDIYQACEKFKYSTKVFSKIKLSPEATSIKFSIGNGTLKKALSNIIITQADYIKSETKEIKYDKSEILVTTYKSVTIEYSNTPGDINISFGKGKQSAFNVKQDYIVANCGEHKTATVMVGFKPKSYGTHTDNLIFSAGDVKYSISLKGNTEKHHQILSWDQDLSTLSTVDKEIQLMCESDAQLDINYTSSNEAVAVVDATGLLTVVGIGTAEITATQEGDNENYPAEMSQTINTRYGTLSFNNDGAWEDIINWYPESKLNYESNVEPSTMTNIEIFGECTMSSDVKIRNLRIANGGKLILNSNAKLRVDTINGADETNLILRSNADNSATLVMHGDAPKATVELYSKSTSDKSSNGGFKNPRWQYLGISVGSANSDDFANTSIYRWDETKNTTSCWVKMHSADMKAWQGYCLAQFDATTYTTSGWLYNKDRTYSLTYTNPNDATSNLGTNLVTNSYSAPIDITKLSPSDFVNAEATIRIFNTGSRNEWENSDSGHGFSEGNNAGQFTTIPVATAVVLGDEIPKVIPPMQGFFIKATGTNASLTVDYDKAVWGNTKANGPMRSKAETNEFNVLKITVANQSNTDNLYLIEHNECTNEFDNGYDGRKTISGGNSPQIYATNEFGNTAVNTSFNFINQYVGFKGCNDSTQYRIKFDTEKLDYYNSLYLYDSIANVYVDILANEEYIFTANNENTPHRFKIVETIANDNEEDDNDSGDITTGLELINNRLWVDELNKNNDMLIFDMSGKLVYQTKIESSSIELPTLPRGVYNIVLGDKSIKIIK